MLTTHRSRRRLLGGVAGLAALAFAPQAHAATHTVCASGCDFTSIAAATAAAANGDVVDVAPGVYSEPHNINVTTGITLQGAGSGQTIIDGGQATVATPGQIRVRSPQDATVRGFTLRNPVSRASAYWALDTKILQPNFPDYVFEDIEILGNGTGSEYGVYSDNSTANMTFDGLKVSGTRSNPILIEEGRGALTITNSEISAGIFGAVPPGVFISKTNPNSNVPALNGVDTTAPQRFTDNVVTGGGVTFATNYVNNNSGGYTDVEISGNTFTGGGFGIALQQRNPAAAGKAEIRDPVIRDNHIEGISAGTTGVSLQGRVVDPLVVGNTITGHGIGVAGTAVGFGATRQVPEGITVTANRIVGISGLGVNAPTGIPIDARENWWGCNEGPRTNPSQTGDCDVAFGEVDFDPWLVLDIGGDPTITHPATGAFAASVDQTSAGTPATNPAAFPAAPVAFAATAGTIGTPRDLDASIASTTLAPPAVNGPLTVSATLDKETVSTGSTVTGVALRPTKLEARALVLDTNIPLLGFKLGTVEARLTDAQTGAPLPGRTITFRAGSHTICSAQTDGNGVARCNAPLDSLLLSVLNLGYTASFGGDLNHAPAPATGAPAPQPAKAPLIKIGGLRLF